MNKKLELVHARHYRLKRGKRLREREKIEDSKINRCPMIMHYANKIPHFLLLRIRSTYLTIRKIGIQIAKIFSAQTRIQGEGMKTCWE